MHTKMPIGIEDFKKLREECYFVDKTKFIQTLLDEKSEVTLLTRPRRFGKTLTMSMLKYFFTLECAEENKSLFDGLSIADAGARYMAEQGKYPVIFVTLKGYKQLCWRDAYSIIKHKIVDLFDEFRYVQDSEKLSATEKAYISAILSQRGEDHLYSQSLALLTRVLYKYHGVKPILLIDEYDVPIQCGWENKYYDDMMMFMKNWLSEGVKTNPYLQFAVFTGVLRIAKESIFSDLNNLDNCSVMVEKYNDALGFTPREVEKLAADLCIEEKLPEIKEWYDGYNFAGQEMYNPWSVIKYVDAKCKPQAYWVNTSGNGLLKELLKSKYKNAESNLLALMEGHTIVASVREGVIYEDIRQDKDALYTMLLTTGYLKIVESLGSDGLNTLCRMAIPNREIRAVYRYEVLDKLRRGLELSDLLMLVENLLQGKTTAFEDGLREYLLEMVSVYDAANKESFYHGFMLGITALLIPDYQVKSNRESGYGRFDVAIIPKQLGKTGVVMEFKVASNENDLEKLAREALAQIERKAYLSEFTEQGNILKYSIAFYGKQVKILRGLE